MFDGVVNNLEGMLTNAVDNYVDVKSGIKAEEQDKGFLRAEDGPPDLNASIGDYVSDKVSNMISNNNINSTA